MTAVVTVTSSPESQTNVKLIKSDQPDSEIILQPGIAEQIILNDGATLSVENVPLENEAPTEEEAREAAEDAGEKNSDEA